MITQIGGASDFTLISVYNGYKNALRSIPTNGSSDNKLIDILQIFHMM